MEQTTSISNNQTKAFYKAAGLMAIFIVLAGLTDSIISMGITAQDNRAIAVVDWYNLFQTHRFEALSRLGMINMLTLSSSILIFLAFYLALRKERPTLAALASILFFIGTAIYLSSNTVFALFAVSQQYAVASAAQKPLLEAAGQALLAQGADLTPGTFVGLIFTQVAGLLITSAMLWGNVFGKWAGWTGLAGYSLMSVFFVLTAFFPGQYDIAMAVAAPGGLIMLAYEILLARTFFQLAK